MKSTSLSKHSSKSILNYESSAHHSRILSTHSVKSDSIKVLFHYKDFDFDNGRFNTKNSLQC